MKVILIGFAGPNYRLWDWVPWAQKMSLGIKEYCSYELLSRYLKIHWGLPVSDRCRGFIDILVLRRHGTVAFAHPLGWYDYQNIIARSQFHYTMPIMMLASVDLLIIFTNVWTFTLRWPFVAVWSSVIGLWTFSKSSRYLNKSRRRLPFRGQLCRAPNTGWLHQTQANCWMAVLSRMKNDSYCWSKHIFGQCNTQQPINRDQQCHLVVMSSIV